MKIKVQKPLKDIKAGEKFMYKDEVFTRLCEGKCHDSNFVVLNFCDDTLVAKVE